jgi:hypothetical protein
MEKMDVDDDAVVDLSVKYVHWYFSQCCHMCIVILFLGIGGSKDSCGTHIIVGYDGFVKNPFSL